MFVCVVSPIIKNKHLTGMPFYIIFLQPFKDMPHQSYLNTYLRLCVCSIFIRYECKH